MKCPYKETPMALQSLDLTVIRRSLLRIGRAVTAVFSALASCGKPLLNSSEESRFTTHPRMEIHHYLRDSFTSLKVAHRTLWRASGRRDAQSGFRC
jgi:hypothetical protein